MHACTHEGTCKAITMTHERDTFSLIRRMFNRWTPVSVWRSDRCAPRTCSIFAPRRETAGILFAGADRVINIDEEVISVGRYCTYRGRINNSPVNQTGWLIVPDKGRSRDRVSEPWRSRANSDFSLLHAEEDLPYLCYGDDPRYAAKEKEVR